jgi:hypothetical protein
LDNTQESMYFRLILHNIGLGYTDFWGKNNIVVQEPKGSTPLISKPSIRYDYQPLLSTPHPPNTYNLFIILMLFPLSSVFLVFTHHNFVYILCFPILATCPLPRFYYPKNRSNWWPVCYKTLNFSLCTRQVVMWREMELSVQQNELLCNSTILFISQRLERHHRLDRLWRLSGYNIQSADFTFFYVQIFLWALRFQTLVIYVLPSKWQCYTPTQMKWQNYCFVYPTIQSFGT